MIKRELLLLESDAKLNKNIGWIGDLSNLKFDFIFDHPSAKDMLNDYLGRIYCLE